MTQQYMAGYPPAQQTPGGPFPGEPPIQPGSYQGPQNMYTSPAPRRSAVQEQAAFASPPSDMESYIQPDFDPYTQQPTGGQLALYNQQNHLVAPAPIAPDGTLLPPRRPRVNSTDSRRSSRSHRSSRSTRSRRALAELEKRPSWADTLIAAWDAFKGAFDKRKV